MQSSAGVVRQGAKFGEIHNFGITGQPCQQVAPVALLLPPALHLAGQILPGNRRRIGLFRDEQEKKSENGRRERR